MQLPGLLGLVRYKVQPSYLFILCLELLLSDVQLYVEFIIVVELAEDVGVVCLALADGGVQGDDDQGLGNIGLRQDKQAHNGVVLYPVVLCLASNTLSGHSTAQHRTAQGQLPVSMMAISVVQDGCGSQVQTELGTS